MMEDRQLNFVLATDSKIVSINSLYGAKIGWNAGKPFPQLYRSQGAMKFEREVREQLLALHLDQDWIDWFKTTKNFSMTVNFILRSGVSRRDVSNCDKALIDTITRFVKYDLGCDDFDDSMFADVHFYKSVIPQGVKEYCCVQIKESTHEIRFDYIPKPEKIWYWNETTEKPELPKIPKRRKKGEIYLEEVEDRSTANTFVYVLDPERKEIITPELFFEIAQCNSMILNNASGFLYVGILGGPEDWKSKWKDIEFLKKSLDQSKNIYSGINCELINSTDDILTWLKQ